MWYVTLELCDQAMSSEAVSEDDWLHTDGRDNNVRLLKWRHRHRLNAFRVCFSFLWLFHSQSLLEMQDKQKTMIEYFDNKFIRLDQKHVGLARQASPLLRCFWSRLINLISKETRQEIRRTGSPSLVIPTLFLVSPDKLDIKRDSPRNTSNWLTKPCHTYAVSGLTWKTWYQKRLAKKYVGLAHQALSYLRCFWSCLINLISKETRQEIRRTGSPSLVIPTLFLVLPDKLDIKRDSPRNTSDWLTKPCHTYAVSGLAW